MRSATLACALVLVLAACERGTSVPRESMFDRLRDATYRGILDEPIVLTDGRFEGAPFTRGSAARPVVTLFPDTMAQGDLTGDGSDETVVALAHNSSGSGVFLYLAIMRNDRGNPENIATIGIGDRVRVTALEIAGGRVIADLVEHAPDDPMCCPTRPVRRAWLLTDGQLVLLQPQGGRFKGHLVWGHDNRSFTECGAEREGWVINEAGDELVDVYEQLVTAPYQPMFVEVRGVWEAAPREGFGAEYGEALRITELLRAENEGPGCRLDLAGALFVASGNEPFWRLRVREDGIVLRSMESADEIVFPAPEKRGQPPLITFDSGELDAAIRVTLERRRCIDTMSGARFAWAATVSSGGRELAGCAVEGP